MLRRCRAAQTELICAAGTPTKRTRHTAEPERRSMRVALPARAGAQRRARLLTATARSCVEKAPACTMPDSELTAAQLAEDDTARVTATGTSADVYPPLTGAGGGGVSSGNAGATP